MSSLLIPTIKYCYTEAQDMLAKKLKLTLIDPMPDVGTVRAISNKVSKAEEEATMYLELLEKSHNQWFDLLATMTGTERIADNATQANFLTQCDYPPVMIELKLYANNLRRLKKEYDNALRIPFNQPESISRAAPPMVRLPQIKLPTFSGDLSEWPSFWERFNHSIHKVDDNVMPPVLKLTYLFECLSEKALHTISGLPIEDSSYDTAVAMLESEFGNTLAIKESLYHSLQSLKPTSGKRDDLRRFIDELEHICVRLIKMEEDLESLPIQALIQDRLPPGLIKALINARHALPSTETWTTERIRETLKSILHTEEEVHRAVERSIEVKTDFGRSNPARPYSKQQLSNQTSNYLSSSDQIEHEFPSTFSFIASSPDFGLQNKQPPHSKNKSGWLKQKFPCLFCQSQLHISSQCNVDLDTRKQILLKHFLPQSFAQSQPFAQLSQPFAQLSHMPQPFVQAGRTSFVELQHPSFYPDQSATNGQL